MDWMSIYLFFMLIMGSALTAAGLYSIWGVVIEDEPMSILPAVAFGIPGVFMLIGVNIMWGM